MKIKLERINKELQKEISYILQTEVRNKNLSFITINDVEITNDYSHAKVYYTTLDEENKNEIHKDLTAASGFIKKQLYDRIELRKIPDLHFIYDESISNAIRIEKKLQEISK